jgi:hypothetical protein
MDYKTPAALESAIKDAAKRSRVETDKAIMLFWWDRFLNRVFSPDQLEFVLKGGLSMLARMGTRYTKDIDLAAKEVDINVAEKRLIELASLDLGDFFVFRFKSSELIKPDDEYRTGKRLVFDVVIGNQRRGVIKVDLVVGCTPLGDPERIVPAHRLGIKGLPTTDYFLYPVEDTTADKVCATLTTYPQARYSSRIKDLIDLVTIATTTSLDFATLGDAIRNEISQRGLRGITVFAIPDEWRAKTINAAYRKAAKTAGLSELYFDIEAAEELVKHLVDPTLSGSVSSKRWNPNRLRWEV